MSIMPLDEEVSKKEARKDSFNTLTTLSTQNHFNYFNTSSNSNFTSDNKLKTVNSRQSSFNDTNNKVTQMPNKLDINNFNKFGGLSFAKYIVYKNN